MRTETKTLAGNFPTFILDGFLRRDKWRFRVRIKTPSDDGFKTSTAVIAERCGAKWTHRHGYTIGPRGAARLRRLAERRPSMFT